jgi:hypothetical protein
MIGLLCFVLAAVASQFKSKMRLEAENAVLRHQLIVVRRWLHGRVRLTNHDRWFFIQLYRWVPSILKVLTIIQPETLVRWRRAVSLLPALEVVPTEKATADRHGAARVDLANHAPSWADFITAMVGFRVFGTQLQSEAGYIDARPLTTRSTNLLQRKAGPYIRVTGRRVRSEQMWAGYDPSPEARMRCNAVQHISCPGQKATSFDQVVGARSNGCGSRRLPWRS